MKIGIKRPGREVCKITTNVGRSEWYERELSDSFEGPLGALINLKRPPAGAACMLDAFSQARCYRVYVRD